MARVRIPKPLARQLRELEHHLFVLRDQLHGLREDPAHLMVIAATLRTLLCLSSGTEGLLWRMIEQVRVSDNVELEIVGTVNHDHPLNRGMRLWVIPFSRPSSSRSESQSLKDVVKRCDAIYSLGKSYTFEDLIKVIAQQVGTAHSDPGIEPRLAAVEEVLVEGRPMYFPMLALVAELTLQVGERVLATAEKSAEYTRGRCSKPWSLSIHVRLHETPLGRVRVASWRSEIAEVTINAFFSPQSFCFRIEKMDNAAFDVLTPLPASGIEGRDAFFTLTYDHRAKRIQAIGPRTSGDSANDCDLGFIGTGDLVPVDIDAKCEPYLSVGGSSLHERIFSSDEVNQLPEVLGLPITCP